MTDYVPSDAKIIRRIPATPGNTSSVIHCERVPFDVPCIVAFGGELTYCDQFANAYAKTLENLFKEYGVTGNNIYSVVYEFGSYDSTLERAKLFRIAGRKLELSDRTETAQRLEQKLRNMNKNEPIPNYIINLYNILLRPRIADSGNKKLATDMAENRMRRIKFYAHCHGAATIAQMAHYMHGEMLKIGYTLHETAKIMKNLLVIQHSPLAPLDNTKFTTLSFASAEDTALNHRNKFSEYIFENSADISPSFFAEPLGNIFVGGKLKTGIRGEHDHTGLIKTEFNSKFLTDDGMIIFGAERNALARGAMHSVRGGTLPSISELVSDENIDFDAMKRNGDFLYKVMLTDLRQQNPKRGHQK